MDAHRGKKQNKIKASHASRPVTYIPTTRRKGFFTSQNPAPQH
uniref:Uncharacterized protein n=1 Tax=Anguilla anguilla TaxID=7936 RepID=A0A0E9WI90_ANGAN